MDAIPEVDAAQVFIGANSKRKLRLSNWLWKPWYVKMWWIGALFYWMSFALSFGVRPLTPFFESTLAGYLNVVFYPPVILMLLGTGFVRAKIRRGDWIITAEDSMLHQSDQPMHRPIDPYTDPFDPKSGSLYAGSAESISRVFGKPWP